MLLVSALRRRKRERENESESEKGRTKFDERRTEEKRRAPFSTETPGANRGREGWRERATGVRLLLRCGKWRVQLISLSRQRDLFFSVFLCFRLDSGRGRNAVEHCKGPKNTNRAVQKTRSALDFYLLKAQRFTPKNLLETLLSFPRCLNFSYFWWGPTRKTLFFCNFWPFIFAMR